MRKFITLQTIRCALGFHILQYRPSRPREFHPNGRPILKKGQFVCSHCPHREPR